MATLAAFDADWVIEVDTLEELMEVVKLASEGWEGLHFVGVLINVDKDGKPNSLSSITMRHPSEISRGDEHALLFSTRISK